MAYSRKPPKIGSLLVLLALLIGISLLFVVNWKKVKEGLDIFQKSLNKREDSSNFEDIPEISRNPELQIEAEQPDQAENGEPDTGEESSTVEQEETSVPQTESGTVKRFVYMIRLDNEGTLVAVKVERQIPQSDSPMLDALNTLVNGPSADEQKRNMRSLIPANTAILGAFIRGSTAYINFSEDFLFNTWGMEGYVGQLRQILWTATEFNGVKDVQILVEGRRIDYLGDGIWVGSPLTRDAL